MMANTRTVYLIDRAYGGPEEGGWWYDTGERVRIIRTFLDCATNRPRQVPGLS